MWTSVNQIDISGFLRLFSIAIGQRHFGDLFVCHLIKLVYFFAIFLQLFAPAMGIQAGMVTRPMA